MAKRNKNREPSRDPTGGVRRTANVRYVSETITRGVGPLDRIGGGFFQPDLTAFDHIDTPSPRTIPAAAARAAAPQVRPPRAAERFDEPSKRAGVRKTKRRVTVPERVANAVDRVKLTMAKGKYSAALHNVSMSPYAVTGNKTAVQKVVDASKAVSHAKHSLKERESRRVSTCKERPDPTVKTRKGGGGGKQFIPWCSRK